MTGLHDPDPESPLMPPLVIFLLGSFAGSLVSSGITAIVVPSGTPRARGGSGRNPNYLIPLGNTVRNFKAFKTLGRKLRFSGFTFPFGKLASRSVGVSRVLKVLKTIP
jgi:hypothetical protein